MSRSGTGPASFCWIVWIWTRRSRPTNTGQSLHLWQRDWRTDSIVGCRLWRKRSEQRQLLFDLNLCPGHMPSLLACLAFCDQEMNSFLSPAGRKSSLFIFNHACLSPYDTLQDVIGSTNNQDKSGSLHDWGVAYRQIELLKTGRVDLDALTKSLCPDLNQVVYLQRSCGYATRPTLKVAEIESVVAHVKRRCRSCLILVDNCYGEFTEEREPTHVGADLVMGSLIKNPGGTIAPTGGSSYLSVCLVLEMCCAGMLLDGKRCWNVYMLA